MQTAEYDSKESTAYHMACLIADSFCGGIVRGRCGRPYKNVQTAHDLTDVLEIDSAESTNRAGFNTPKTLVVIGANHARPLPDLA